MNLTSRPITQKCVDRVNNKLRESAKKCPHCMGCGMPNHNGDSLCLAHSNRLEDGKGRGIKAEDSKGAILCQVCHDYVDGRSGFAIRADMQSYHQIAHVKTVKLWMKVGLL